MYQERYEYDGGYEECNCDCDCECGCCEDGCSSQNDGCIGPAGPMGPRGPRGPQGPRGLQGSQGKEGIQGPRGPQGVTGPQGSPGIQGIAGPTGPQGLQGEKGSTGAIGAQGPQGPRGATGPAGESSPIPQFASGALYSYACKQLEAQTALQFDISSIQCGVRVSENYKSLIITQPGTYMVEFGMLSSSIPCHGDSIALELNHTMLIEESRMPVLCEHTFVTGVVILALQADDELSLVADCANCFDISCSNNTINAYVVIHQINS